MSILFYGINAGITALGRALDLLSTYYITPNLEMETNTLIKKLGYRNSILLQVPLIIFGALLRPIAVFFFAWSVIIASSNISGAWFVRNLPGGDKEYTKLLRQSSKKAKWRNILLDESPPLILYSVPSIFVWVGIHLEIGNVMDLLLEESFLSYVLIITGALMLHGIMGFLRNILYINRLRKERRDDDENEEASANFE
ncbi:MAG: hypothetical protein ACTSQI_00140 [Candidatus Helarchaeota archaeon]